MEINLGGDRLGSGQKMQQELHNYYRSTHDLGYNWLSSMNAGVLYPFMVIPAVRGEKFTIDLQAAARTIPTKGPLFGSYKMQLDIFYGPIRLYQAWLHNNPNRIGMNMNQLKFPQLIIKSNGESTGIDAYKMNNSSLMKYLGLSGLGHNVTPQTEIGRRINAIPALLYYDIFKQYYANKQEENAYVIGLNELATQVQMIWEMRTTDPAPHEITNTGYYVKVEMRNLSPQNMTSSTHGLPLSDWLNGEFQVWSGGTSPLFNGRINDGIARGFITVINYDSENVLVGINAQQIWSEYSTATFFYMQEQFDAEVHEELALRPFKLDNIDDMRMEILSFHTKGVSYKLGQDGDWSLGSGEDGTGLPYSTLFAQDNNGISHNNYPQNGLMVKTYQSDIYNNWLDTELIDGENGVAALTAISTQSGSFTIDALNLSEKLYDMYNRIIIGGGTYEDWQNVVYTKMPRMQVEMPIYCGGMSNEIVFEEIVQSAPGESDGENTKLGTLGGRGVLIKRKGGKVTIKTTEAGFIMGIVSITPRICYTQGNEFYLTDWESMDDLHKPALDGIGFQNLIGERLAWFDTALENTNTVHRSVIGKIPAWSEYMTNVDKAYGDFADDTEEGKNFMVLSRRYERDNLNRIADATTYVDPSKHNYAFAYRELGSQNFWVQIKNNIIARRLMSAKQIPTL